MSVSSVAAPGAVVAQPLGRTRAGSILAYCRRNPHLVVGSAMVLALLLIEALSRSSEGRLLPAAVFGQVASPLGSDRAPVGIGTLINEEPSSDGPAVSFEYSTKGLFFTAVLTSPPSALLLSMKMTEARPLES